MELWIRSQDKRHLIKADYVSIMENNIINVASSGWDYDVAKYKSEERALEVLDEIQHKLITLCDSMNRHLYVYEMPKE